MKIKEKTCKTALSDSKLPGLTYALNPYVGCMHQCTYCYVPSVCHISYKQWEGTIFVKRNIPLVLSKELKHKPIGTVGISTVTDPYQPIEKSYHLTRYCLEQLHKKDFPISIQTKSSLVTRDKDIITQFSSAEVMMSIATADHTKRIILEPNSSSISDRIAVFDTFKNTTVTTSVFLGPLYPLSEKELQDLLDTFLEKNVSKIMIDHFHLKPGIHEHITKKAFLNPSFLTILNDTFTHQKNTYAKQRKFIMNYLQNTPIKVIDAF